MKKIFLLFITLLILFCTFILVMADSYSKTMFKKISNNFLRLHIVANSDSTEDQMIKYEVRDAVISYMSKYLENVNSKESAIKELSLHADEIQNMSQEIIKKHQLDYPVKISIRQSYFPTKTYGNITLPEGKYDALKIEIGNASGQNWWCVMYPCLCTIENVDNYKDLEAEEYSLISDTSNSKSLKIKFKLIELFENL